MLLLLVVLLLMSALISASETAFFSLNPTQISKLRNENSKSSISVLGLLDNQDRLLSTLLLANNLVNIGAILVANSCFDSVLTFNDAPLLEFTLKVVTVTFLLLLFGEIMPKIYAAYNNYTVAKVMALPITHLTTIFRPVSYLLTKVGALITNTLSGGGRNVSMDELQDAIDITKTETLEDKKMLSGIVRFVGTEVDEIMKPRIDVVAIDIEATYSELRELVISHGFSRIPVYEESFDHVRGILFIKDLIPHLDKDDTFEWQKLLREPYFVPEHKKINDLLADFQEKKMHLAIVVDEYGGTLGIISLEDILEEIVGEISDESDAFESFYTKIDEQNYLFDGKIHIVDCERILALYDDYFDEIKGDADTLAGLMLEIKGEFFALNDSVEYRGIRFTATELDNRRITKIHVLLEDPK